MSDASLEEIIAELKRVIGGLYERIAQLMIENAALKAKVAWYCRQRTRQPRIEAAKRMRAIVKARKLAERMASEVPDLVSGKAS